MSHFAVLVIGNDWEKQLAPYHEFECTGENDEYVQDVDVTEQVLADWNEEVERVDMGDGTTRGMYDDFFYKETPEGKVRDISGYATVKVPRKAVENLAEWLQDYHGKPVVRPGEAIDRDGEHKYGYSVVEGNQILKVVDRTNPNAKWDWYVPGGRWSSMLKLKPGANGAYGEPSTFDRLDGTDPRKPGYADQALKGDVDWEGMRNEAGEAAGALWDRVHAVIGDLRIVTWQEVREEAGTEKGAENWASKTEEERKAHHALIEAARKTYREQEAFKLLNASSDPEMKWIAFDRADIINATREETVEKARKGAILTFAVVKDGTWYERGSMGWWGMVSDEVDTDEWATRFTDLLDGLPDDTLLTVVDCHI